MPCPHHPDAQMNEFTAKVGPNSGKLMRGCGQFLGKDALGANRNGYCSFKELVPAGPVAAPVAATATPASGAVSQAAVVNPRLQAAQVALECASRMLGPTEDILIRASRYYHEWLKPASLGDPPTLRNPMVPAGTDDDIPF